MNNTQHYQMTLEELMFQYEKGFLTTTGLLFNYIRIKFPTGQGIELEPKQVCAELGISRSQFYKSIAKLKKSEGLKAERTYYIVMERGVK